MGSRVIALQQIVRRLANGRAASFGTDSGVTLVEIIVAFVLVSIVLLGGLSSIDYIQSATAQQKNVVQASTLNTQYDELFQADAYQDGGLAPGTYTYTNTIQNMTYTTNVAFTIEDQSGNAQTTTLCTNQSELTGILWGITTTTTWKNMSGAPPVTQTTEIAPGKSGANSLNYGAIAVQLLGTDGQPLAGTAIHFTLSEIETGSGAPAPALPNNGQTSYTTSTGCAVVTNLVAEPNWDYEITIENNPGWVSSQELSDETAPSLPTTGPLPVSIGQVTKAPTPISLALGTTVTTVLQPVDFLSSTCTAALPPACDSTSFTPASDVPVSVASNSLANGLYAFGIGQATPTSILVYPGWFPYAMFSGDQADSSPSWSSYPTSEQQSSPQFGAGSLPLIALPVYDLQVSAAGGSTVTAVEQGGDLLTYTLPSTGGSVYGAGVPTGQYELEANGTPLSPDPYVWVTAAGCIAEATSSSAPPSSGFTSGPVS